MVDGVDVAPTAPLSLSLSISFCLHQTIQRICIIFLVFAFPNLGRKVIKSATKEEIYFLIYPS